MKLLAHHPRRSALATLLCLVALLVAAGSAVAQTYYVSPSGSDSASGSSPSQPWRTVSRADQASLRAGDRVLFQGGHSYDDNTLMPGEGHTVSGTASAPVVFGSYGGGLPVLPQGIWFRGEHDLVFDGLQIGPTFGINATGAGITVSHCLLRNFFGAVELPLQADGTGWRILGNRIDRTGDSGMVLRGSGHLVSGNTITNTGLDRRLSYGTHGIYLKSSDSTVTDNTIIHFRDNGISVRYGNSTLRGNQISDGKFGIAWFQAGSSRGTSHWSQNTITGTTIAGIYVSPDGPGGPDENFVISGNLIARSRMPGWVPVALSHNRGRYSVRLNQILSGAAAARVQR